MENSFQGTVALEQDGVASQAPPREDKPRMTAHWRGRIKSVAGFLTGALAAQGLSAVTGLLLTRWLSVEDYAVYTVLAILTGALTVLTMGGVNIAFSTIVGRVWPDRQRAADVLAACRRERHLISAVVLPFFLAIASWLLLKAGASVWLVVALLTLLMIQWFVELKSHITDQILLFAQRAARLQSLEAALGAARLAAVALLHAVNGVSILLVTVLAVIGAALRVPFVQKWARQEVPVDTAKVVESDRKEIRSVTLRQLPVELYYCFQSQVPLFLLAAMSAPAATASFGALGRLAQLFVPISMLVSAFAIPRFAQTKTRVLPAFMAWSLLGLVPGLFLVVVAAVAPSLLLMLIGPNYAHLQREVLIASIYSATVILSMTMWRLAANRGWNRWTLIQIPVFGLWCAGCWRFLDMTTLDGVLVFQFGFPLAMISATLADLLHARAKGDLK
ncbi:hypothetical protein ACFPPF_02690 [Xenophilus aerolatus]|nr:hypothetical protein [Xenophilus aerolatus]